MKRNFKKKICLRCGKRYFPTSPKQKYCGSRKKKQGCALKEWKEYNYKWDLEKSKKFRKLILGHYGGKPPRCRKCGIKIEEVLTIDHIKNNGAEHRRKGRGSGGHGIYAWLVRHNYPPGYQVLCRNCNWLKYLKTKD